MDDLRFAVFGTGFWSHFQLAAWNELKGVKCVALYNRTVSIVEKMASEFGIPAVYGDAEELLSRERLDFVDIITDPWTHSKFVQMAAAYKLPVICQKPMDPTLAEAEKMVKTCREAGVPYFIHENWRWQTPVLELKKVLDSGAVGTPFRARMTCVSGYHSRFMRDPHFCGGGQGLGGTRLRLPAPCDHKVRHHGKALPPAPLFLGLARLPGL